MKGGPKITKYMDIGELPSFFRELADALETGGTGDLACVEDFVKFKISGKNQYGKLSLKARFKQEHECLPAEGMAQGDQPASASKPEYKTLKKRMKSSFRMLVKMIHDNEMPPGEAVQSFLDDSALMVTYPGYGDEYYDKYTKACEAFKEAFESGDLSKMHEAIDVLVHEKGRCHAQYD